MGFNEIGAIPEPFAGDGQLGGRLYTELRSSKFVATVAGVPGTGWILKPSGEAQFADVTLSELTLEGEYTRWAVDQFGGIRWTFYELGNPGTEYEPGSTTFYGPFIEAREDGIGTAYLTLAGPRSGRPAGSNKREAYLQLIYDELGTIYGYGQDTTGAIIGTYYADGFVHLGQGFSAGNRDKIVFRGYIEADDSVSTTIGNAPYSFEGGWLKLSSDNGATGLAIDSNQIYFHQTTGNIEYDNTLLIRRAGVDQLSLGNSLVEVSGNLKATDVIVTGGSSTIQMYHASDTDTGIRWNLGNQLLFVAGAYGLSLEGGASPPNFGSFQGDDSLIDLGASDRRWRRMWLSQNGVIYFGDSGNYITHTDGASGRFTFVDDGVDLLRIQREEDWRLRIIASQGFNLILHDNNPYTNGTGDYVAYWDNDILGTNTGWAVTTTVSSGAAVKKNIRDYDEDAVGAAFLRIPMRSWQYDWDEYQRQEPRLEGKMANDDKLKNRGDGPTRHWYVADEVEAELPWLVGQPDGDPVKRIKDGRPLQVAMIAALRHLNRKVESQQERIETLEARLNEVDKILGKLDKGVQGGR